MNGQIFLQGITLEQLADALKPLMQQPNIPAEQTSTDKEFLTRKEVCERLSFNLTTLYKHTKSGKFKSYSIGNRVLYKLDEVLAAVEPINR
jgi:excisionase family DNA binding protein